MLGLTGVYVTLAAASLAVPAADKQGELIACMWENMPASTATFVDNVDRGQDFSLMMKAISPCGDQLPTNIKLDRLRKALAISRPVEIGADKDDGSAASVCSREVDGQLGPCRPAGK